MRSKRITSISIIAAVVAAFSCSLLSAKVEAGTPAENAIGAAARQNQYVFVTFYKNNDSASKAMLADLDTIQGKFANRADFVKVDVGDRANRALLSRYGADRSPVPLTIVIAPNGAITGGFPRQIDASKVPAVFVSNGTAAVLKVMQAQKIAAVCIQDSKTKYNKECQATARGIKSDSRLNGAVDIVTIDSSDRSESKLLKQWGVNANSANAQLVVVAPPGKVLGKFDGAKSKNVVMVSLMGALNGGGCGGGTCGPSGCK